jgi:hypothetical protein
MFKLSPVVLELTRPAAFIEEAASKTSKLVLEGKEEIQSKLSEIETRSINKATNSLSLQL